MSKKRRAKKKVLGEKNPHKNEITKEKYELIDYGPMFMRCAIKSCELLGLIHLNLTDNKLGFEETKMLWRLISLNSKLRTLNLSRNALDSSCAYLIMDALNHNSNLKMLDISDNRLGDLGVQYLLHPMIQKCIVERKIHSGKVPVLKQETGKEISDISKAKYEMKKI